MKIVEFDGRGQKVETDSRSIAGERPSHLAPRPTLSVGRGGGGRGVRSDVQLYMFQTGTLRTKLKYIKMNQGECDLEIPVPWYLIKHPKGNVVIDGGNALEVALDKRAHWGDVVDAYDPVMDARDNCVDQCRSVGVRPEDVRYVVQSHLHLDHTGAIGRFPRAEHIVQRLEYEYAFNPDWFSTKAYIRADFDRPNLSWKFLGGEYTDNFDLFGDGVLRMIFTPGHSPGHQSFLVTLPNSGPFMIACDAVYTMDHWENRALPGLVCSAVDAVRSVNKLHKIVADTNATLVAGHDTELWRTFRKAPSAFYD